MRVVAIIKENERVLVEMTQEEIANIMGKYSIYSEHKQWMEVGSEIPISAQYNQVQKILNIVNKSKSVAKAVEELYDDANNIVALAEKLTELK